MEYTINHPDDDQLDRHYFSKNMASYIHNLKNLPEGYVIGIEGEWGAGKSSTINMLLLHLLHLDMEILSRKEVFYGDIANHYDIDLLNKLSKYFIDITGYCIPSFGIPYIHPDHYNRAITDAAAGDATLRKQIYRYFRMHQRLREDPLNLVLHFNPWLIPESSALPTVFINEISKSVGDIYGTHIEQALSNYAAVFKKLAPIAGLAANVSEPGTGTFINSLITNLIRDKSPTINESKNALERELNRLKNRKLVIIIDDLDRLTPKETVEMFGLVKNLGNLPNIVYVLSYDRSLVSKQINSVLGINGQKYLDKIVQYSRHLPIAIYSDLTTILNNQIINILEKVDHETSTRFAEVWENIAIHYIKTPRDVNKCGLWFKIAHNNLKDYTDVVDLFLLEVINLCDNELYLLIKENIFTFTNSSEDDLARELKRLNIDENSLSSRVLSYLFPEVANIFAHYSGSNSLNYVAKRIHINEFSNSYFNLAGSNRQFSISEIQDLFSSSTPEIHLRKLLDIAKASNYGFHLRSNLFNSIQEKSNKDTISLELAHSLVGISEEIIENNDKDYKNIFSSSNDQKIIFSLINFFEIIGEQQKYLFLKEEINNDKNLSTVFHLIRAHLNAAKKSALNENGSDYEIKIKEFSLRKIHSIANNGTIFNYIKPQHIFYLWSELDSEHAVYSFISKHINSHINQIINLSLSEVNSTEGVYFEIPESIKKIIDIDLLYRTAIQLLNEKNIDSKTIEHLNKYIKAYNRNE